MRGNPGRQVDAGDRHIVVAQPVAVGQPADVPAAVGVAGALGLRAGVCREGLRLDPAGHGDLFGLGAGDVDATGAQRGDDRGGERDASEAATLSAPGPAVRRARGESALPVLSFESAIKLCRKKYVHVRGLHQLAGKELRRPVREGAGGRLRRLRITIFRSRGLKFLLSLRRAALSDYYAFWVTSSRPIFVGADRFDGDRRRQRAEEVGRVEDLAGGGDAARPRPTGRGCGRPPPRPAAR